jgi:hypothetical protein
MTLVADKSLVDRPLAAAAAAAPAAHAVPTAAAREVRIDLFRGLALWLIFLDHLSPDLLSWFTIRSYGFSDAAEIFIFISGYTAAMVYGRIMGDAGFTHAAARIWRRVWQIYLAHVFVFTVLMAAVWQADHFAGSDVYAKEVAVTAFFERPGEALGQALILRFRPLNMDVLPLYIVLMALLPPLLWLLRRAPMLALGLSAALYAAEWKWDIHLSAWPDGFWSFNPFAWQFLFVIGAWCSLGGAKRLAPVLAKPLTLWAAGLYIAAAFALTLTWDFPSLEHLLPDWAERWIYPIDKPDLDILRLLHFLALAVITVRVVPAGWPGLSSRWLYPLVLCGRHSLEIFCLGVVLSFAGYFLLSELHAGLLVHVLVAVAGIALMTAIAWLTSWHKHAKAPRKHR